jgi:hypothetical protein
VVGGVGVGNERWKERRRKERDGGKRGDYWATAWTETVPAGTAH